METIMSRFQATSLARHAASLLRAAAMLLLAGAGLASIIASGGAGEDNPLAPEPVEVIFESAPRVAFRSDGTPVVAYRESTERGENVRARLRIDETFFDIGQTQPAASDGTRLPLGSHVLGSDPGGTVLSLHSSGFHQTNVSAPGFRACRSTTAAPAWECVQLQGGSEQKAALAMAGTGIALGLMTQSPSASSDHHDLWSTRHSPSFGWTTPQLVGQTFPFNTSGSDPAVVFGVGLTGYAMFLGPDKRLMVRHYEGLFDRWEGVALSLGLPFGDTPPANGRLVLHRDAPNAAAMALYLAPDPGAALRLRAWRADGPSWRATPDVPGSESADAMEAAMDAAGDVLAVWRCDTGASAGRVFASRYANGAWSTAAQEIGSGGRSNSPVKVAVDAQGHGVALWRTATELVAANFTPGSGWQAAQPLGAITSGPHGNDFEVRLDDAGHGLAVWVRDVGAQPNEGTRVARQAVGPLVFSMTAPRHVFGGDAVQVTFRRGDGLTQANFSLQTGALLSRPLGGQILFESNQRELTVELRSAVIPSFVDESIVATYAGVRYVQPITLMPEPTALTLEATPSVVRGGGSSALNLRVEPTYPVALDVQLASNNTIAPVPAVVSTGLTASTAVVPVNTASTTTTQSATFTATLRGRSGTTALSIIPATGQAILTVAGSANGSVSSAPGGISLCAQSCSAAFPVGTVVTLTASPAAGHQFVAWTGDADCADGSVTLNADKSCSATFAPVATTAQLNVAVVGNGSVASTPVGIACPGDCSETYPLNTVVALTATPAQGSSFVAWSGACSGTAPTASVTLAAARSCSATFVVPPQPGTGWSQLGNNLAAGASTTAVALAVDRSVTTRGNPVIYAASTILTSSNPARYDLLVQRYDGVGAWQLVGGGSVNADSLLSTEKFTPSLVIEGGNPVVAWTENAAQVRVKKFTGIGWVSLSDDLRVDTTLSASDPQMATYQADLVVAWVEGDSGIGGRMALKRRSPQTPDWTGGIVLPTENNVLALRVATELDGMALLMFAPYVNTGTLEGPLRVLREGAGNTWSDVCSSGLTPASAGPGITTPNARLGFGIARSVITAEPIAVINNGVAVFVRTCRGGAWTGLDGSAQGQVSPALATGESLAKVSVARSEGMGLMLAWAKYARLTGGGDEFRAQVLVENSNASAMQASGPEFVQADDLGQTLLRSLPVEPHLPGSPVLATTVYDPNDIGHPPRVYRFVP
jgi:hypothetical protein